MKRLVALALLSAACASRPEPEPPGAAVRVTNDPAEVASCRLLGEVDGHSGANPKMSSAGFRERKAHERIKEAAAKLGGDTVLLTFVAGDGSAKRGDAYRCR